KLNRFALGAAALVALASPAAAKKKGAEKKLAVATEQTVRAVGELAGKFTWGMTPDDATRIIIEDIQKKYEERLKRETNPFRQDSVRNELADEINKFKSSYTKFDGQKTGSDVSIIDREFAHKNSESMMVVWEKHQR